MSRTEYGSRSLCVVPPLPSPRLPFPGNGRSAGATRVTPHAPHSPSCDLGLLPIPRFPSRLAVNSPLRVYLFLSGQFGSGPRYRGGGPISIIAVPFSFLGLLPIPRSPRLSALTFLGVSRSRDSNFFPVLAWCSRASPSSRSLAFSLFAFFQHERNLRSILRPFPPFVPCWREFGPN